MTFLNVAVAAVIGKVVDSISGGKLENLFNAGRWALLVIVLYLLIGVFYVFMTSFYDRCFLEELKNRILNALSANTISQFQKHDVSYYYNILTQDIEQVKSNYIELTYDTVVSSGGMIVSLAALLWINVKMTIVFIFLTLLVMLIPMLFTSWQTRKTEGYSGQNEAYVNALDNVLAGFESIKLLNIGLALFNKLIGKNQAMEKARMEKVRSEGITKYAISTFTFLVQIGCLFYGAYLAIQGEITTGEMIMAVQLLNFLFPPIQVISNNRALMKANKVIRDKLEPYLDLKDENNRAIERGHKPGALELKNFSLTLGNKKILDDFNYRFEPGRSYVVIGPSGCGKSTLAKSLAGYYDDFSGELNYGTLSASVIPTSLRHEWIRYIGTNTYVINDSVFENIRLYRDIPEEEIEKVAKIVGFDHDFLHKADLGHGGKYVSSGEYQRIAIARALLDKPYCLIFDEPTANLDPINTAAIQKLITEIDVPIKIVITHDYTEEFLHAFDAVLDFKTLKSERQ